MRGTSNPQAAMFSYISLEDRVPANHPLRRLRVLVDAVLAAMDEEFSAVYATKGRPSIPPERLLKASLLQILFSIRSERILVEHIDYNLLYRWFVGLSIDESVWDHSTFSHNRDRLFNEGLGREFFERVRMLAEWGKLTSDEHFSVDGTLIEAWASHKSFRPKDGGSDDRPGGGGRNEEVDFRGERRSNETHESSTDPEARLSRKSAGSEAKLAYMTHVMMEHRSGLIVDVETTESSGRAEREAALAMIARRCRQGATIGADRGYDTREFVAACRKVGVAAHVARKRIGSAVDGRVARSKAYQASLRVRKRIEEAFGWLKTVGGLRKTRLIGRAKLSGQALLCFAAYNLVRMGSIAGWWNAGHT
jgi:transposase